MDRREFLNRMTAGVAGAHRLRHMASGAMSLVAYDGIA
jgi:hypothetical protein